MFAAVQGLVAGKKLALHLPKPGHLLHSMEHSCHLCYFGLVFFEAHGTYRFAAMALLVMGVLDFFVKVEEVA